MIPNPPGHDMPADQRRTTSDAPSYTRPKRYVANPVEEESHTSKLRATEKADLDTSKTSNLTKKRRTPLPSSPIRKSQVAVVVCGHRDKRTKTTPADTKSSQPTNKSTKSSEASEEMPLGIKWPERQLEKDRHVAYFKSLLNNPRRKHTKEHWKEKCSGP